MPRIPRDGCFDATLALLRDPYRYISRKCRQYKSNVFMTRLQLKQTLCMSGSEAAEVFYDTDRFERRNAAPGRLLKTLFGEGGVQGLDDEAHRHRKAMFLLLTTPERVAALAEIVARGLRVAARRWAAEDEVALYAELQELLCRAVCAWAGVPLDEQDVKRRTRELTRLFDGAGSVGWNYWASRIARKRADAWIERLIERIRLGEVRPPEHSAAYVVAWHRDRNEELLDPQVAAVELLNILRPTVAVSVYITQAAAALQQFPQCREQLALDGNGDTVAFVQEVRRFYPFFPFVAARVRRSFEWKGFEFTAGRRVLLDLYGVNHDPDAWDRPEEFRPQRFRRSEEHSFRFIPQGGGEPDRNHRCPGEGIAVELMKTAVRFLSTELEYDVPPQNLEIDFTRTPALPRSQMVVRNVRFRQRPALELESAGAGRTG